MKENNELNIFFIALQRTSDDISKEGNSIFDWYNGVRYDFTKEGKLISSYRI